MRRLPVILLVIASFGMVAGCAEVVTTAPETVEGEVPQPPPEEPAPEEPAPEEPAPEDGGEPAGEGDSAAGKAIFVESCGACHTLSDAGTGGSIGPNLDGLALDFAPVHEQVVNGGGAMPPFEGVLDDQQINDVSAYVVQASAG